MEVSEVCNPKHTDRDAARLSPDRPGGKVARGGVM